MKRFRFFFICMLPLLMFSVCAQTNLAIGKRAIQICDYKGAVASRAIDGNTDGVYANGSVSHTCHGKVGDWLWWMVDLGSVMEIDGIEIYRRTDPSATMKTFHLDNWVVMINSDASNAWRWEPPQYFKDFDEQYTSDAKYHSSATVYGEKTPKEFKAIPMYTNSPGYRGTTTARRIIIAQRVVEGKGNSYLDLAEVKVWTGCHGWAKSGFPGNAGATGLNVNNISIVEGTYHFFNQIGCVTWEESSDPSNKLKQYFRTYTEIRRTESALYLLDEKTNEKFKLDLVNKVVYKDDTPAVRPVGIPESLTPLMTIRNASYN